MTWQWNNIGEWSRYQQRFALALSGIISSILLYFIFLNAPLASQTRLQHKIQTLTLQTTPQENIDVDRPQQQPEKDLHDIYISRQHLASWLNVVAQLAQQHHLILQTSEALLPITANFYNELPIHLRLLGSYPDLTCFVAQLTELKPLFLAANFTLEPKNQGNLDNLVLLDLTLHTFSQNAKTREENTIFTAPAIKKIILPLKQDPFAHNIAAMSVSKNNFLQLDFQDISVRSALQNLAKVANINIIISDKVQSKISVHLQNITWQEALNVILQTEGLGQRKIGHSILVAPLPELLTYDKQQVQIQDDLKNARALQTNTFQLKYGKAQTYYDTLKNSTNTLLSPRGKVVVNPRTNFLWVEDHSDNLKRIRQYIEQTDVALRQVEIEARIVTVDKSYEQQLGIKWNVQGSSVATPQGSGNRAFNLDLGAGAIDGTKPGSIALATLANDVLIGLELSALEAEGNGEVLSSPRLLTADQQEAIIEQGQEIPYQENAGGSTGATTTSFKQAVLRLKVTPQIISDDKLLLRLEVNQDAKSRDTSKDGIPLIDTRHISTNILIHNGETVVLGGIYERNKSDSVTRIPFISDVPIIGNLFKHRRISDQRNELLIFVTPRIVSQ